MLKRAKLLYNQFLSVGGTVRDTKTTWTGADNESNDKLVISGVLPSVCVVSLIESKSVKLFIFDTLHSS